MRLVVKWEGCQLLTWGSLWVRITSLWPFGMGWKRDFGKGLPCGKDNLSPKEGESLQFVALCQVYAHIFDVFTANAKSG